jgi:regulatory protein
MRSECGTNKAEMRTNRPRKPRPPLDDASLRELALTYVARFATSRAKLADYLRRKLRERGWAESTEPPIATIVDRIAELGYVDDAAFALGKARSLSQRGYGARRIGQALRQAGIDDEDSRDAHALAADEAAQAALRFARRRRIGPFSDGRGDRPQQEKWLSAMIRAGHGLELSRRIILWPHGIEPDAQQLAQ